MDDLIERLRADAELIHNNDKTMIEEDTQTLRAPAEGRSPASTGSEDFAHSGVWCCSEKSRCQWQGFALHCGLAWGTTAGTTPEWRERHDENCKGRLIQLLSPNNQVEAREE